MPERISLHSRTTCINAIHCSSQVCAKLGKCAGWRLQDRAVADREGLERPTDVTSAEWALVTREFAPQAHGRSTRRVDLRSVVNGILHLLTTGCHWRAFAKSRTDADTVFRYLHLWEWDGTLGRIHQALYSSHMRAHMATRMRVQSRASAELAFPGIE